MVGMNIPDSKEYDTFSGFILNTIGRIPEEKEEITIGPYLVRVESKDGNRIKEYSVKIIP